MSRKLKEAFEYKQQLKNKEALAIYEDILNQDFLKVSTVARTWCRNRK